MTRRWAWRGEDHDESRPPRRVAEGLSELSSRLKIDDPLVIGRLTEQWADAVGEVVAEHARPKTLRDGTLVIEADSPEWATQLRFLEGELLDRIARVGGADAVSGLRITVRRTRGA